MQKVREMLFRTVATLSIFIPKFHPRLRVLCYHSVSNDGLRFSISTEEMMKQISHLLSTYSPLDPKDLHAVITGKSPLERDSFVITFDDGYEDLLELEQYLFDQGIRPIVFTLAQPEHADRVALNSNKVFLKTKQIQRLRERGWEIGSHSATHADLVHLSTPERIHEVQGSKNILEKELGFPIRYFAYPKGFYDKHLLRMVAEAHYEVAFTVMGGFAAVSKNRFTVDRIGIDGTHSFAEFKALLTPSAATLKSIVFKLLHTLWRLEWRNRETSLPY